MPGFRPTAWLRPLLTLAAIAGVLSLAACGGGNGAPSQNNAVSTPLSVLPATASVYSGTPVTLTVSGGTPPYSAFSADQSILPVQQNVSGNSITIVPNQVTADTEVDVTIRDSKGVSATAALTVKAALLINSLTLKADNFSDQCPSSAINSTTPTDTNGSTWICSGQTGSLAVRLQNGPAGGLAGQYVRFDIVQGDFQIFTEGPGQPNAFARCYIVPTDQNGNAVARILANPSAPQQIVIVQASVLGTTPPPTSTPVCDPSEVPTTGNFVRGLFVIQQVGQLSVVPTTVTITGPDTQTCSAGVVSTFYIFGGTPPYTIRNTFPQALIVAPTLVAASGGGFNVTTNGACVNPATISIADAAGHQTTVTLINQVGTTPPNTVTNKNPIVIGPTPIPTLTCGASTNIFVSGGGTSSQQGNSPPVITPATQFLISTDRPDILQVNPTSVGPLTAVQLTRLTGSNVDASASANATVHLNIFDGNQSQTFSVTVTDTCP
ncbi:MAG TPA: hypothetical protein VKV24_12815 [Casimicrobiaceae bacterium]|nr:hypothetical protein [Casimicrobiaceae bacterium]